MTYYIRCISVASPGTRNEHIHEVQHSSTPNGSLTAETVASVATRIGLGIFYRSHNDHTGSEAPVITRTSASGRTYIATIANGGESDNLLSLPRY